MRRHLIWPIYWAFAVVGTIWAAGFALGRLWFPCIASVVVVAGARWAAVRLTRDEGPSPE